MANKGMQAALLVCLVAIAALDGGSAQCVADTEEALCNAAVPTISLGALGLVAATLCTIILPAGVIVPALPLPTTTNGAVAVSLLDPIVAAHTLPFVGSFDVIFPAQPVQGCPGGGFFGLGATPVTCTKTCNVGTGGTVTGEPHFVGFDGSRYDFQGVPDAYYSLLTDNEHSLNAQFVARGQRLDEETNTWFEMPTLGGRATVVGGVGLTFKGDMASIRRTPSGEPIIELNGKALALGTSETSPMGLKMKYTNTSVPDGSLWMHPGPFTLPVVTLTTDRYEIQVSVPLNYDRRMDLSTKITNAPNGKIPPAEGVVGQTLAVLYGPMGSPGLDSAFDQTDMVEVWDSEEMDHIHHSEKLEAFLSEHYTVTGLFSHDAERSNVGKNLALETFQVYAAEIGMPIEAAQGNVIINETEQPKLSVARRSLAERSVATEAEMPTMIAGVFSV